MNDKKWTKEEVETHILTNCDYGSVIVCGALFFKLYGVIPKLGLSGYQAEAIEEVRQKLPDNLEAQ